MRERLRAVELTDRGAEWPGDGSKRAPPYRFLDRGAETPEVSRLVAETNGLEPRTPWSRRELHWSKRLCPPDVQGGNQEVNILTTRFGLIQACETDVILIPEGLLGFRSFTHYVHIPDPVAHGLSWLQSLTAPGTPAFRIGRRPIGDRSDYRVELRQGDRGRHSNWRMNGVRLIYVISESRRRGRARRSTSQGPAGLRNPIRRLGRQLVP